jgi:O-antigen/teichoic acid export membrane protein
MKIKNFKNIFFENSGIKQTLFKNAFWLASAEFFSKGIYFLVFIWLARYLGPEVYGQWSFALSFVSFFAVFVDFGFTILIIKELARDKTKSPEYVGNILTMKLVLSLLTIGLAATIIEFLSQDPIVINLVYFLSLYIVINNFGVLFQAIFRANEKMEYEAFCRILQSVALLLSAAFLILSNSSVLIISFAFLAASFIGAGFSLLFIRTYLFKPSFKVNLKIWKEIVKKAWPFLLSGAFYMIYYVMGSIMLGLFSDMKEVGYYNAACNLFFAVFVIPDVITVSFFPKISYFYEKNKTDFKKIFFHYRKTMIIAGLLAGTGLFLLSDLFVNIIYSSAYFPSIFLLKILSFMMFFKSLSFVYNWFLFSSDEQKKVLIASGLAALLNIILNYFLIIRYNAVGATVSMVITEIFLLAVFYFYFKKKWRRIYGGDKE